MVSLRLNNSPRVPSFWGPFTLGAVLMLISNFSEPIWQNFYVIRGTALNTSVKVGAWGVCTRLRNTTGVNGPTTWCSDKHVGYTYYVELNTTGIQQFPTIDDDATLLGTNASPTNRVEIIGSGATSIYWIHVAATIAGGLAVLSLILKPKQLGSEDSRLFALQKSGVVTILLAITASLLSFISFIVELAVAIPARNRLNDVPGVTGHLGNIQWFSLPSSLVMLVGILSVLLRSTVQHEYVDL
ncbi:hypothetical protein JCM8115_005526 [Rhodotorula mucilaginosa]|uniref:Uncharacterized protein n=1 Tax=Rhodotorula mucilaginosa TaxID=5537 RepID=A0A9P6W5Z3_RHOMI|nr:hypothetical protein C6P46_002449 [Rhodotorula mucilaginosa]TKA52086.1 hypothetical protein B0A53_04746 [Rhodotorula sp. CCFEE 5036]